MRRSLPDIPWLSAFPELNLRLYVERDGKPGVWFLSLDAANPVAVWAARRFFHLPYFLAEIAVHHRQEGFAFSSRRTGKAGRLSFRAHYRPSSPPFEAKPGSIESFLTERYCLYAQAPSGAIYRADVHHVPWPLREAIGEVEASELIATHGFQVQGPPILHFSSGVDVVVWPMEQLAEIG
jgi:uncharacterized protein YqjF (DUF2071 family)